MSTVGRGRFDCLNYVHYFIFPARINSVQLPCVPGHSPPPILHSLPSGWRPECVLLVRVAQSLACGIYFVLRMSSGQLKHTPPVS